jgi:hypothetical protein
MGDGNTPDQLTVGTYLTSFFCTVFLLDTHIASFYNRLGERSEAVVVSWSFPIFWEPLVREFRSEGRRGCQSLSSERVYKIDKFQEIGLRNEETPRPIPLTHGLG